MIEALEGLGYRAPAAELDHEPDLWRSFPPLGTNGEVVPEILPAGESQTPNLSQQGTPLTGRCDFRPICSIQHNFLRRRMQAVQEGVARPGKVEQWRRVKNLWLSPQTTAADDAAFRRSWRTFQKASFLKHTAPVVPRFAARWRTSGRSMSASIRETWCCSE